MIAMDNLQSLFGLHKEIGEANIAETHNPPRIEKLPPELKQRLASFLSTRDLLNLAETSKTVSTDLNISVSVSPLTDRASQNQFYRSSNARCFAIVIPTQDPTLLHSMTFTCKVEEHGYCPATVFIVEQELPLSKNPGYLRKRISQYGTNSTVRKFTRMKSTLSLSFPINPNKFYQLYVTTHGYALDHFVSFSHMSLHQVGFSKSSVELSSFQSYQFDVFEEPTRWEDQLSVAEWSK